MWESLEAVQRAVDRLYEGVTIDIAGDHQAQVRVERQDLDEMLGNLVENAAKYGGGRVFVTVQPKGAMVDIEVEDDGPGIPVERRGELFTRGARLDTTGKPGTGLGLAIVRDVAEIYGGSRPPRGKRGSRRPAGAADPARRLVHRPSASHSSKILANPRPRAAFRGPPYPEG